MTRRSFRGLATTRPLSGYIFNLSTVGLTTGTYKINFNVSGDPSLYSAPFQVK
jgi:hypothetical protein